MTSTIKPLVIAHRGERVLAPENTIKACQLALDQGATGLEIDVRICGSGEIVLIHDPLLQRHFNIRKTVARTSLKELKALEFPKEEYRFHDRICTLEEILEEFKGRVPINLDAKSLTFRTGPFAEKLAAIIQKMNVKDQVWISSFNPVLLSNIKAIQSTIRTGYLFQNPAGIHRIIDFFLTTDAWHPHFKNVSERFIERARKLGKEVYIWTVNDKAVLEKIQSFEYHGIISDRFFRRSPIAMPEAAVGTPSK